MEFWDSLSQKAKEASDVVKLNKMIFDEESQLKNLYRKIGEIYAETHWDTYGEEFSEVMSELKKTFEKIHTYRQQLCDIKGVTQCSNCGAEVERGAVFCSSCGAAISKAEQPLQQSDFIECPKCGSKQDAGNAFCAECGTKF